MLLEPYQHLPKMTDEELLKYTRREEKKNAKRASNYFKGFSLLFLGIVIVYALIK